MDCHTGVYHGDLPRKRRELVRKQWLMGQLTIICATSAFGMGVDRADVRFVVHHSITLSLSASSQQIGTKWSCWKTYGVYSIVLRRADTLTTERRDVAGNSSGPFVTELEDVVGFCEMGTGCQKELLYHSGKFYGSPLYIFHILLLARKSSRRNLHQKKRWRVCEASALQKL
ncbi:hypothetical protein DVH05_016317 [Phytophthora capsici]|nr:hypothetical protein DVH05_016317 [Phytophthora capsici]